MHSPNKKARLRKNAQDAPEPAAEQPAAKSKRSKANSQAIKKQTQPAEQLANVSGQDNSTHVGSGRQAAQGIEYKEKPGPFLPDSKVAVKQQQIAGDEMQALQKTQSETSDEALRRRVIRNR